MSLWTIVPIRGLASGKSRLATVLDTGARTALNQWLLARVLEAVDGACGGLTHCIVVSADPAALALACQRGAVAMEDPPDAGLNGAIGHARSHALAGGAQRLLVIASDLPEITAAALEDLLAAVGNGEAAVVADESLTGTNGLLLPADVNLTFAFGGGSLAAHRRSLQQHALPVHLWQDAHLAFDLDTPDDLARLRDGPCSTPDGRVSLPA